MTYSLSSLPEFLQDTLQTMTFYRRSGEWDIEIKETISIGKQIEIFEQAFHWATIKKIDDGEISLDLIFSWVDEKNNSGKSIIPNSGKLLMSDHDHLLTFTIWPNFFTNTVPIYLKTTTGFVGKPFNFVEAARCNREQLSHSLQKWEKLVKSPIIGWESELIKGIEQYGFSEQSKSI